VFFGLVANTDTVALVQAVLEGVAFGLAQGVEALREAGVELKTLAVIGGGSRSAYWGRLIAAILEVTLHYGEGGEVGPAYGAARLARLAMTGEPADTVCLPAPTTRTIEPDAALVELFRPKRALFAQLYSQLTPSFKRNDSRY